MTFASFGIPWRYLRAKPFHREVRGEMHAKDAKPSRLKVSIRERAKRAILVCAESATQHANRRAFAAQERLCAENNVITEE